jgi:hypothetical protein
MSKNKYPKAVAREMSGVDQHRLQRRVKQSSVEQGRADKSKADKSKTEQRGAKQSSEESKGKKVL